VRHVEHSDRLENMLPGTVLLRVTGKRLDPDKPNGFVIRWHASNIAPCLENGFPVERLLDNTDQVVSDVFDELAPRLA
jgi:hypothetical protein